MDTKARGQANTVVCRKRLLCAARAETIPRPAGTAVRAGPHGPGDSRSRSADHRSDTVGDG